jgi:hypothetical protein
MADDKTARIAAACRARDTHALAALASSPHGLVNDSLRRAAWPLLLGVGVGVDGNQDESDVDVDALPPHTDEHQVDLDVNRAFVYYPPSDSPDALARRQTELNAVIVAVLRRHPALSYFQGYHDIVQVLYLVLGPRAATPAAARLSLLRIRDFMLSSLDPAVAHLQLLRPLLRRTDPALYHRLPRGAATFALAGTLTMFAHNLQHYHHVTRLFDFFLAHHPVMPIYLFAAVALSRRDDLLAIDPEDQDILHVVLSKLPDPFDVEFHISRTLELYERLPPASLRSWEWWSISSNSVLKTASTADSMRHQTLQEGERYFARQEKELRRKLALKRATIRLRHLRSRLWYYRRYGSIGLALLVGAYAIWLGKGTYMYSDTARLPLLGMLANLTKNIFSSST